MNGTLLDILVDPMSKMPLKLEVDQYGSKGAIAEGTLHSSQGKSYPITNGIPRFVLTENADQRQTAVSFGFKWQQRDTYDSPEVRTSTLEWQIQRYGFRDSADMLAYFGNRRRILDAGCGSALSSSLWLEALRQEWVGVDISAAIDVAQERIGHVVGTHFVQADILQLPFQESTFDTIVSEGVLHHTPSAEQAMKALVPLLEPGGEFLFYVYRKKGPIREFTDDYVREIVSQLPAQEAWALIRPLTRLGMVLSELKAEVEVPEDIPYLGIKAGRYDVQRLIYWHFAKLFWNERFSFEENNHVNFDWYHPRYAHRHTENEVRRWCDEAGLTVAHFDVQESGFTVRAVKG